MIAVRCYRRYCLFLLTKIYVDEVAESRPKERVHGFQVISTFLGYIDLVRAAFLS